MRVLGFVDAFALVVAVLVRSRTLVFLPLLTLLVRLRLGRRVLVFALAFVGALLALPAAVVFLPATAMVIVPLIFPLGKTAENVAQSSLVELSVAGPKSVAVVGNCHRV